MAASTLLADNFSSSKEREVIVISDSSEDEEEGAEYYRPSPPSTPPSSTTVGSLLNHNKKRPMPQQQSRALSPSSSYRKVINLSDSSDSEEGEEEFALIQIHAVTNIIKSSTSSSSLSTTMAATPRILAPPDFVFNLNESIILLIFAFLRNGKDLARCSLVCRQWKLLANTPSLWKSLCELRGWKTNLRANIPPPERSWKWMYACKHRIFPPPPTKRYSNPNSVYSKQQKLSIRSPKEGPGTFIQRSEKNNCVKILYGDWHRDVLHGYGYVISGTLAICYFRNGVPIVGREYGADGQLYETIYEGQWIGDSLSGLFRSGFGSLYHLKNGEIVHEYVGEWKSDLYHGIGKEKLPNGDFYEGEFRGGLRNGIGRYVTRGGNAGFLIYHGQWLNDTRHGYGLLLFPNGEEYEGEFVHDFAIGNGKQRSLSGDVYQGRYEDGEFHGHGTVLYSSGGSHEGAYAEGQKNGHGVEKWPNGDTYVGNYRNGKRHGHGIFYRNSKSTVYVGRFKGDLIDGHGTLSRLKDGHPLVSGKWKKGKPLKDRDTSARDFKKLERDIEEKFLGSLPPSQQFGSVYQP